MATEVVDYISVRDRAAELGCANPERMALLPTNFQTAESRQAFRQLSEAATVKTLFRVNRVPMDELLPQDEKLPYVQNNSFEWFAPTLFVASSLWSQNPSAVSLALNVLANYITDFFKGSAGKPTIKIDIVVERKGDRSCKKLRYEGDVSGLTALTEIVERIADE